MTKRTIVITGGILAVSMLLFSMRMSAQENKTSQVPDETDSKKTTENQLFKKLVASQAFIGLHLRALSQSSERLRSLLYHC